MPNAVRTTAFCLLLLTSLSIPLTVSAVMVGLSTADLTSGSDAVVTGRVGKVKSHWSHDGKVIVTQAQVAVERQVRGNVETDWITVEYTGGEVDGIGLRVSDMAPLQEGENVLLFLKSGPSKRFAPESFDAAATPVYNMVGKAQGKYAIGADGMARKSGFAIAGPEQGVDRDIPLDDLISKIRKGE